MKFQELNLHPNILAGLNKLKFEACTPIQEQVIPVILEGKDVSGLAQTGTGKTAAFLLPLMERILRSREFANQTPEAGPTPAQNGEFHGASAGAPIEVATTDNVIPPLPDENQDPMQKRAFKNWQKSHFCLVLTPTRELAEQISQDVVRFGTDAGLKGVAVYGGSSYDPQREGLKRGVEFVVGTPGRLIDLYKTHALDLKQVRAVVFDEADRMFDMGFKDDMKFILQRLPQDRQILMFSATLNFDVLTTAYHFGSDPVEFNISKDQAKADNVKDWMIHTGHDEKPQMLLSILKKENPKQAMIFSNFKFNVERVSQFLTDNGYPAMGISSLLTQAQRNRVIGLFKEQENNQNILVATDVAARGLDIKGVDLVVNYDLPEDAENYVHRIGRTGRAGNLGTAISMVSDRDVDSLQRIEDYLKHKVEAKFVEETDIVKDFKPLPYGDGPRFRSSGPRSEGGGDRGRKPRAAGGPGGRSGGRDGGRGPRSEGGAARGPVGGDRPYVPGASRAGNSHHRPMREGAEPRPVGETHRDRQSGRHEKPHDKHSGGRTAGPFKAKPGGHAAHAKKSGEKQTFQKRAPGGSATKSESALGKITKSLKKLFGLGPKEPKASVQAAKSSARPATGRSAESRKPHGRSPGSHSHSKKSSR